MQIEILHRTSISATLGPIQGSHVTPTTRAHTSKLIQLGQFTITSFRDDLVDVSLFHWTSMLPLLLHITTPCLHHSVCG
jgi:hypothetical protein